LLLAVSFTVGAICLSISWWMPLLAGIPLLFIGWMLVNAYPGISFAISTMIAPANLRATALAIFTVAGNLLGYAVGPPVLGAISDWAAARAMTSSNVSTALCDADPALAQCIAAQGDGLRIA